MPNSLPNVSRAHCEAPNSHHGGPSGLRDGSFHHHPVRLPPHGPDFVRPVRTADHTWSTPNPTSWRTLELKVGGRGDPPSPSTFPTVGPFHFPPFCWIMN